MQIDPCGPLWPTLACMMDLHYYPLDSQNCTVEIESCKIDVQPIFELMFQDILYLLQMATPFPTL